MAGLPPPKQQNQAPEKLEGIGGWLLAYFIIVILSVVYELYTIVTTIIAQQYASQIGFYAEIIPGVWSIVTTSIFILINVCIFIFILRKKRYSPKWIIGLVWTGFVVGLIEFFADTLPSSLNFYNDLFAAANTTSNTTIGSISASQMALPLILASSFGFLIGIAFNIAVTLYFLKSKRVKNTFVK